MGLAVSESVIRWVGHGGIRCQVCWCPFFRSLQVLAVHQFVGVARWLGCQSLAGGLSLICAWYMVDMWPLHGLGVRYASTNHANSAFHPSGVGKWVVIHVITWITGMETIKRQIGCVWLVGHKSACVRRLSLRPIGPTPAWSVTWTAPLQLRYAA